jgi:hypothetical protein
MRVRLPQVFGVAIMLLPMFVPLAARGQSNDQAGYPQQSSAQQAGTADGQTDDQDAPRVGRLSATDGDVSFQRAGDTDWARAVRNLPLLAGDQIYTGAYSHAEIQLSAGIYIRLGEKTNLAIADLDDSNGQFEITAGSATIQSDGLKSAFDRLEIDTPVTALLLIEDGVYRVDVDDSGGSVAMVRNGSVDVSTTDGTMTLKEGRMIEVGPAGSGQMTVAGLNGSEIWDLGNHYSNGALADAGTGPDDSSPSGASQYDVSATSQYDTSGDAVMDYSPSPEYVNTYQRTYDSLYGVDELAGYGTWTYYPSYGNIWLPRTAIGWTPFRYGQWLWVPATGWTWLPSEPWGWAPYHYGRWSFVPNLGWAWVPGFGANRAGYSYAYSYYQWRPAMVSFFNYGTPTGRFIGWAPLAPGQAYLRPATAVALPRTAALVKGVSVMPEAAFSGALRGRPEAPGQDLKTMTLGRASVAGGLGNVQPSKAAESPIRSQAGGRALAVVPPPSVASRAVITRRLPSGTSASTARQRTLVDPGRVGAALAPTAGSRASSAAREGSGDGQNWGPRNPARAILPGSGSTESRSNGGAGRTGGGVPRSGFGPQPSGGSYQPAGSGQAGHAAAPSGAPRSAPAPAHSSAPASHSSAAAAKH